MSLTYRRSMSKSVELESVKCCSNCFFVHVHTKRCLQTNREIIPCDRNRNLHGVNGTSAGIGIGIESTSVPRNLTSLT